MRIPMKNRTLRALLPPGLTAQLAVAVAVGGALFAACNSSTSPGTVASITVTPSPGTLTINATQQFTAVGKDANGNVLSITPTWSVVASGGTISSTGLFTAGATAGTFANTVKATSGSVSGTATVIVSSGALATIAVTP